MRGIWVLAIWALTAYTSFGWGIGIIYNETTAKNELRALEQNGNVTALINDFEFDTGFWSPSSFNVDPFSNRVHAYSSGFRIYTFDINTGEVLFSPSVSLQEYRPYIDGMLLAINYDESEKKNEALLLDPETGETEILAKWAFSEDQDFNSWMLGTWAVDRTNKKAYAIGGQFRHIFQIDLISGEVLTEASPVEAQTIDVLPSGEIVSVSYNSTTEKNEIHTFAFGSTNATLRKSFAFDTGFWRPFSFRVDWVGNRCSMFSSEDTLYVFDFDTDELTTFTGIDSSFQSFQFYTPIINIPERPANNANLVSLPFNTSTLSPWEILNETMGTYTGESWEVYAYDSLSSAYSQGTSIPNIQSTDSGFEGKGFWMRALNEISLNLGNADLNTQNVSIELTPGWNLIGNPFMVSLASTKMEVELSGEMVAWSTQQVVSPEIWEYNGTTGEYTEVNSLEPFKGYWVNNQSEETVTLRFMTPFESPDNFSAVKGLSKPNKAFGNSPSYNPRLWNQE